MDFRILFISFLMIASCSKENLVIDAIDKEGSLEVKSGILFYKKKPFSGELIAFYDAEKRLQKLSCFYLNGKKNGIETKWYSNSVVSSNRTYKNNSKVGVHKGWWSNGNLKFEYIFNDEGQYSGVLSEWYENGNKFKEFHYSKGKEEGSQKLWKLNGDIRANYVVKNGERFGLIGMKKCDPVSTN